MDNSNYSESIRIPLTPSEKEKFKEACHWNRESMSEAIRKFIAEYKRIP